MRILVLQFFSVLVGLSLFSCSSSDSEPSSQLNKSSSTNSDSLRLVSENNSILDNPIRNTNNFTFPIGNGYFDSLNHFLMEDNQIQTIIKEDLCGGDCCLSYKTMINANEKKKYVFSKGDCSEYGFSNDQFFLVNDSLKMTRNFSFGVEFATDTSPLHWSMEEKIYSFEKNRVIIKKRNKLIMELENFDFSFGNTPFITSTLARETEEKTKLEELNNILNRENLNDD